MAVPASSVLQSNKFQGQGLLFNLHLELDNASFDCLPRIDSTALGRAATSWQLSKATPRARRRSENRRDAATNTSSRFARARRRGAPALREPAPRVRQLGAPGRVRQESWVHGEELRGSM